MHQPNLKQIKQWDNYHALALLISGAVSLYAQNLIPIAITAFCSFLSLVYSHRHFMAQYTPWGGYANLVTLTRLFILIITACFYTYCSEWVLFAIFSGVIALDVLDGYLARKLETFSDLGLYFDMESDSLLVCLISMILFLEDYMPAWILIVGFLRYLNVFVFFIFQLKPRKEPKRKYASYIAGFLFFAVLMPFVLPQNLYFPIVTLASVLVTLSFIVSFIQYLNAEEI